MKRSLFFVLLALVAVVAAYEYFYPAYSYRYRLTVNIEADGKLHTGSSVIDVTWSAFCLPDYHFNPELGGQAVLVDLGRRGVVVATLYNGEDYGPAKDGAWGAIWLAARAFGNDSTNEELPALEKLRGKRDLVPDDLPRFVWLSNPQDPMTARKLLVQDFPTVFGPSVRFAGASLEITRDPTVVDIRDKLPWLKSLEQMPPGEKIIYVQEFPVTPDLFVGLRS
jgi:hypothetical protein